MAESSSLRSDIISAYIASGAKIASWVVVSAIVFRIGGIAEFGMLALIRATIGILQYASLGLGPAMVKLGAQAEAQAAATAAASAPAGVLSYYSVSPGGGIAKLYSNAISFAAITALVGVILIFFYAIFFTTLHRVPANLEHSAGYTAAFIGFGLLLRLISDAPAGVLQIRGRIARDNRFLIEAEIAWIVVTLLLVVSNPLQLKTLLYAGQAYLLSSLVLLVRRANEVRLMMGAPSFRLDPEIIGSIFRIGGLVTLAQLADYLYAPTDYILINRFLGSRVVAIYAPAIQIDAAMLLLVAGLAAVLFPRSAVAHSAGDIAVVRKYYLRGTLASAAILLVGSVVMWAISPLIFRAWLGNSMPATRDILPLVLIHTVIGGSAMVGRSVLLAAGKFTPFAISVLLAGAINVIFSFIFVRYLNLGLKGIIYGTIIAVVARCVLWMPWYVMRSLKEVKELPVQIVEAPQV
ncbi:MAG TPA: MATE family efflux transporter [Tepidisphaeraceae bacterium]|nr:MATE family efflux transporter [Tepidisphaeraceae bacterium]